MRCSHCHAENEARARFCGECGRSLAQRCPRCNELIDGAPRFCTRCGAPLGADAASDAEAATVADLAAVAPPLAARPLTEPPLATQPIATPSKTAAPPPAVAARPTRRRSKLPFVVAGVVVLGAGAAAAYFLFIDQPASPTPTTPSIASAPVTPPAATTPPAIPAPPPPVPPSGPTPWSASLDVPPGSPLAARRPTASPIENVATLPPLPSGASLVAAASFGPDGLELPEGVRVTWTLAAPRIPGSPLQIVRLDPSARAWRPTGGEAAVDVGGLRATGTLHRFSVNGLASTPLPLPPELGYRTEWVWLLSRYEEELDDLGRELSRRFLKMGNRSLTASEWLSQGALSLPGVSDECLATARAAFASRKKRLEDALAESLTRWLTAARAPEAAAIAAIWQAVADLRKLAEARKQGVEERLLAYAKDRGVSQLASRVGGVLDSWIASAAGDIPVLSFLIKEGGKKLTGFAGDKLKAALNGVLASATAPALGPLADELVALGDHTLFALAYGLKGTTPDRRPGPYPDYFVLGGALSTELGFHTGLGLKLAENEYLDRLASTFPWECGGRTYYLKARQFEGEERLERPETVDVLNRSILCTNGKLPSSPPTSEVWDRGNFDSARERFMEVRRRFSQEVDAATTAWFEALGRATRGGAPERDKLLALGAVRLLRADLKFYIEKDSIPYYLRGKILDGYADWLTGGITGAVKSAVLSRLPGLRDFPGWLLGPFVAALKGQIRGAVESAADLLAKDELGKLPAKLEEASLRVAGLLRIEPKAAPVVSDRAKGIAALFDLRTVPERCGEEPKPPEMSGPRQFVLKPRTPEITASMRKLIFGIKRSPTTPANLTERLATLRRYFETMARNDRQAVLGTAYFEDLEKAVRNRADSASRVLDRILKTMQLVVF